MSSVSQWAALAQKYGKRYKIPTNVLLGLIDVETGGTGNPNLTSPAGAQGLTQFMPGTARQYKVNVRNPESSIRGAAEYLTALGYQRDPKRALASYNGGPGNPQYSYASEVLKRAGKYGDLRLGGTKAPTLGSTLASPPSAIDAAPSPGSVIASAARIGGVTPPAPPSFSAQVPTPQGYQAPPGVDTTPQPDLRGQLQQALQRDAANQFQPAAPTTVGSLGSQAGSYGPAPAKGFKGGYPLGKRGTVIGTPYSGTHTVGNWQSDNAVDIRVPVGTPVYAESDGTISRAGLLPGEGGSGGGRFSGQRVQVDGRDNSYWYGHLSKLTVKQGQRVKKGQLIGYSGEANGVPHLHFGIRRGDPRKLVQ